MEEKQKVLDLFDSDEIKSLISELIDATDAISKKQPIIGFHHKFYVPGWVGLFQLMAVESKMSKFEQQPFYKDMNYLAFADWIISSSEKLANLQNAPNVEGEVDKESDKYKQQSNTIIVLLHAITDCWINAAPEVATIINREYTKDTKISLAGIVYKALEENLKPIGYQRDVQKESSYNGPSLSDIGNNILAIICNLILFALIAGLISLIFG